MWDVYAQMYKCYRQFLYLELTGEKSALTGYSSLTHTDDLVSSFTCSAEQ